MTPATEKVTRGAMRLLLELGYAPIPEISLTNRRRADIVGLNSKGRVIIVEVKSCLADFRADAKWPEYLAYCDEFFFAVDSVFPIDVLSETGSLPDMTGVMIADEYGADIIRPAAVRPVQAARRKKLTLTAARAGAHRLAAGIAAPAQPSIRSLV